MDGRVGRRGARDVGMREGDLQPRESRAAQEGWRRRERCRWYR